MADDAVEGLDDAALEALLSDVDKLDTDTDAPPVDWKPPTYAEWKAEQAKLAKANGSAKNIRLKLAALQGKPKPGTPAAIPPKPGTPASGGNENDKSVDAAALRAEIEAEYQAKQDAAAVQSAAVTALVAAGLKLPAEKRTAAVRRAVKLLDLDGVTADDSAALDSAIDDVKDLYPGLFDDGTGGAGAGKPSAKRRLGGPGAAAGQGQGGKAVSNAEALAAKIFGTS